MQFNYKSTSQITAGVSVASELRALSQSPLLLSGKVELHDKRSVGDSSLSSIVY